MSINFFFLLKAVDFLMYYENIWKTEEIIDGHWHIYMSFCHSALFIFLDVALIIRKTLSPFNVIRTDEFVQRMLETNILPLLSQNLNKRKFETFLLGFLHLPNKKIHWLVQFLFYQLFLDYSWKVQRINIYREDIQC